MNTNNVEKDTPGIATPRPWKQDGSDILGCVGNLTVCILDGDTRRIRADLTQREVEANAALIVHRVNHYEQLLAIVEKLTTIGADGYHSCGDIDNLIDEAQALLCGEGRGENTTKT